MRPPRTKSLLPNIRRDSQCGIKPSQPTVYGNVGEAQRLKWLPRAPDPTHWSGSESSRVFACSRCAYARHTVGNAARGNTIHPTTAAAAKSKGCMQGISVAPMMSSDQDLRNDQRVKNIHDHRHYSLPTPLPQKHIYTQKEAESTGAAMRSSHAK